MSTNRLNSSIGVEQNYLHEMKYAIDQIALTAVIHSNGLILAVNERFFRRLGLSEEEAYSRRFDLILSAPFREYFSEHILPILMRGIVWKGELCHIARNEQEFWTETTIVPIFDSHQQITHYQCIAFEVTERKVVEGALFNNSVFFSKLMNLAPTGFFLADGDGNCTYINKRWSELTGKRLYQAFGMGWIGSIFPDDQALVLEAWHRLVTQDERFQCEYRYEHPSGKIVWVSATAERVELSQDLKTQFMRVETDLTEHRESERLIHEQQANLFAASKMSSLGEMAGGIAHEINNPLAILQLRAMQITKLLPSNAPNYAQLLEAAESINATTSRIAGIVRAMRAISRDGHSDPLVSVPIKDLVNDTLELCIMRFRSQGVDLQVEPFDESLTLCCRSVEILQVLLNLLNNTFSALEELPNKWVVLSIKDREDSIEFWVTDSGLGIPPDLRDKIFQPFFTIRPIGSGTGLGLSICKAVARHHQGDLYLDPECENTRFILSLPKRPLDPTETPLTSRTSS